jgi:hypothetical protein
MMRHKIFALFRKTMQPSTIAPLPLRERLGEGESFAMWPHLQRVHPLPTLSLKGRGLASSDLLRFAFGFVGCVLRTTTRLATTNDANCKRRNGAPSAPYALTARFV